MKRIIYILFFISSYCIGQTNMYYPLAGMMSKSDSLNLYLVSGYNADNSTVDVKGINTGTIQGGVTYTTGIINQAFKYNGTTGYVQFPSNAFDLSGDFSMSTWIYFDGGNRECFFSNQTISPTSVVNGLLFYTDGLGLCNFRIYNNSSSYSPAISLNTNAWNFIVVSYNSTTHNIKMYRNGTYIGNAVGAFGPAYVTPNYPTIGAKKTDATTLDYFSPSPQDITLIYNIELSPQLIQRLYNSGAGKQPPF